MDYKFLLWWITIFDSDALQFFTLMDYSFWLMDYKFLLRRITVFDSDGLQFFTLIDYNFSPRWITVFDCDPMDYNILLWWITTFDWNFTCKRPSIDAFCIVITVLC